MQALTSATTICGSDLHNYRGEIPMMEDGDILGHEFMGIVEDARRGVANLRRGDRVVIPSVIGWGSCYCSRTLLPDARTAIRDGAPSEQEVRNGGRGLVRARGASLHAASQR
jgi:threonine dehydrogenase-like Zn-dependent dehydrogenase